MNWRHVHCSACEALVFEPQEDETVYTQATATSETTRLENLYETNRNFRRIIKTYMHAQRSVAKPFAAFRKVIATKKAEVAEQFAQIKAQYEGLANVKKDEIQATPEYKAYLKAVSRQRALYQSMLRNYNLHRGFYTVLQNKQGLRRLCAPRYRYTAPQWLIRRALHLRLRM